MAVIKSFQAIRPQNEFVSEVAALPYDVFNRKEAKEYVKDKPISFLNIDRPETAFSDDCDMYARKVYECASKKLSDFMEQRILMKEENPVYYIYELIMDGRAQTGIVGCASIDDYLNNIIKKHENTREEKEKDRISHVDICNAQTGPIFLAYRKDTAINEVICKTKQKSPLYSFIAEDGIKHSAWIIDDISDMTTIKSSFEKMNDIYIADGHHRCASAVKVGLKRRKENPNYTGEEEFNYFLSVLFADEELMILDYNRVVKDLNNLSKKDLLEKLPLYFEVKGPIDLAYVPRKKGEFGMYLEKEWYGLTWKEEVEIKDPVKKLDVSILQDYCLKPLLGICDPKVDTRIDFVGGIRGLEELEKRVGEDMKIAFSMYPTSIEELFSVADANLLMPPKSTWFEPKLRSGLFIHSLESK